MTRPRSTTIYVKKRAVMVERKAVRPSKWQTLKKISAWKANGVNPEINPPSHASGTQEEVATPGKIAGSGTPATLQSHGDDPAQGPLHHQPSELSPYCSILDEVERCLSHRPIAFPRKLWGEVL